MRSIVIACAALSVVFGSCVAQARQVCLPGTGLSCGDSGGSYDPTPDIVSRNQRIAAGMNAAGALVNLLGVVLDMVDRSSSSSSGGGGDDDYDADREVIRRLEQGERVEACRQAAAWSASGRRQLHVGDYTSAEAHFAAAVQYGNDGHCGAATDAYERDQNLTLAYIKMLEAVEMIGKRDFQSAEDRLLVAGFYADGAGSLDLKHKILDYRRSLHDKINKGHAFKEKTSCVEVNGQMECD